MADVVVDINVSSNTDNPSRVSSFGATDQSALLSVINRLEAAIDRLASKIETNGRTTRSRRATEESGSSSTPSATFTQSRMQDIYRSFEDVIRVPPGGFTRNLPMVINPSTAWQFGAGGYGGYNSTYRGRGQPPFYSPPLLEHYAEYTELSDQESVRYRRSAAFNPTPPNWEQSKQYLASILPFASTVVGAAANTYAQNSLIPSIMMAGGTGLDNTSLAQSLIQQRLTGIQAGLGGIGAVAGAAIGSFIGSPVIGAGAGYAAGSFAGNLFFGESTATQQRALTLNQLAFQTRYRGIGGANSANIYSNIANANSPELSPDFWLSSQASNVSAYQNLSIPYQRGRGLTQTQATNIANLYNVNASGMAALGQAENFGINALRLSQEAGSRGLDVGTIASTAMDFVTRGGLSGQAATNLAIRTSTMGAPFQQQVQSYYSNPVITDLRNRLMARAVGENYENILTTGRGSELFNRGRTASSRLSSGLSYNTEDLLKGIVANDIGVTARAIGPSGLQLESAASPNLSTPIKDPATKALEEKATQTPTGQEKVIETLLSGNNLLTLIYNLLRVQGIKVTTDQNNSSLFPGVRNR